MCNMQPSIGREFHLLKMFIIQVDTSEAHNFLNPKPYNWCIFRGVLVAFSHPRMFYYIIETEIHEFKLMRFQLPNGEQ